MKPSSKMRVLALVYLAVIDSWKAPCRCAESPKLPFGIAIEKPFTYGVQEEATEAFMRLLDFCESKDETDVQI